MPSDVAAAVGGDRRAADRVLAELRTTDDRSELLDAIAAAAAGGSQPALELLLTAVDELGLAIPSIRRLILEPQAVADVGQDVLIVVAERIASFRGEARFTTWLHQVARFKAIDHLRRQRDVSPIDGDEEVAPSDAVRMSSMIATRASIRDALEALPDVYKGAVVLRDVEQLSYDEVAARLEIPVNTAKTRVARGRALTAGAIVRQRER